MAEMKVFETSHELAEFVGTQWRDYQNNTSPNAPFIVSSPLSSTPKPLYRWVIENSARFSNWSQFRFLIMDEQFAVGIEHTYVESSAPTSFVRFARTELIDPLSSRASVEHEHSIILPNLDQLSQVDVSLSDHGGIDLLILAVGLDGHYAQVMPGTPLTTGYHVAKLSKELSAGHTYEPSSPFFGHAMSEYGMSLGPMQVLQAKAVYVLITGEQKRAVTKRLMTASEFDPNFPISVVKHPRVRERVTICLTKDALTL
jgi:6-phosphogluconolactonase/glucosamine-6-phosphate isomerase/deaminase